MFRRIINGIGFLSMILGMAGVAGNIEFDKSVAVPLLIVIVGALMLGFTTFLEVLEDERKNNSRHSSSYHRNDARPYYLR